MVADITDRLSNLVVARYKDGRLFKGRTFDFSAEKDSFFIQSLEDLSHARPRLVHLAELKAVFFVRCLQGNASRRDQHTPVADVPPGERLLLVQFTDGEIILGTALVHSPGRIGFFLTPVDPSGNNQRVFVVSDFVRQVRFVTVDEELPDLAENMNNGTDA